MSQLVSILIPAYNAQKWIRICLQSAIAQTWGRKEIIVIDDGSVDATLKIARSYASRGVLVLAQENRGASAARNKALSVAQGDYIQWLDADDILTADKITRQIEGAELGRDTKVLLSSPWGRFFHRPERSIIQPSLLWEDLQPAEWLIRKAQGGLWMAIESWLVSRKITEMAGTWDETLTLDDDGHYFCKVISCSDRIRFVPEAMSYCRRGNFGISHDMSLSDRKLESHLSSLLFYIQSLTTLEDSPRSRSACLILLQRLVIDFFPERMDLVDQMQSIANKLGGTLTPPKLNFKYRWIQKVFGWKAAKKVTLTLPALRGFLRSRWERVLSL